MPEKTVEQYLADQAAEWHTYVATEDILIDGVRAFNVGNPVPVSHVTSGVVREDQVAKTTTKAGRQAAGTEES